MRQDNLEGIPYTEEEMYDRAVSQPLEFKIKRAVGLLRLYQRKALQLHPEGYWLAFSGGKDSCVIKQLAIEAGVRFKPVYNQTTIDPPELTQFIRAAHPDVEWRKNEKARGFFEEVIIRGLPTPRFRWCCQIFKECGGEGWFKVVGVRAPESNRRKRLWKEQQTNLGGEYLAPICYWTDEDVWKFIRSRGLAYCKLYDEGYARLGCVGCPLAGIKNIDRDFARWPRFETAYKNAAYKYAQRRIDRIRSGEYQFKKSMLSKGIVDTPDAYWFRWRNQLARAKGEERCRYEEMLSQIGIMSIRELNESYYDEGCDTQR